MDQEPSPGPSQTQTKEITSFAQAVPSCLAAAYMPCDAIAVADLINEEGLKMGEKI